MKKSSFSLNPIKIAVVGLGHGGSWAVTRMVRNGVEGVEPIAMDTDYCSLQLFEGSIRVLLGGEGVKGFGTNGNYDVGREAAEDGRNAIKEVIRGAEMVFIVTEMGGGAGTGSAPVVAEVAKEIGALTIAIVTKPFDFEGEHRLAIAENGMKMLEPVVDTTIIIPNDKLFPPCGKKFDYDKAFERTSEFLADGIRAIIEVITVPGMINLDLSDVRTIMKDAGTARMSIGTGSGQNRAADAAKAALASPLLDVPLSQVEGVFFNVSGDGDMSIDEVNQAAEIIKQAVNPDAKIKFGAVPDSRTDTDIKVTLFVSGFEKTSIQRHI